MSLEDFEKKVNEAKVTLVDFYAVWCGPCKALSPVLDEIKASYEDLNILKLDVEQNEALCYEFNIRSVPTLMFFKNGEVEDMTFGNVPKDDIVKIINNLID